MKITVPTVLQENDYSCGQAVFRSALAFWQVPDSGYLPPADPESGTHAAEMCDAFSRAGFRVLSGEMDLTVLGNLCNIGRPVACQMLYEPGDEESGHWVLVHGVGYGKVMFMDPLDGPRFLELGEWKARWWDFDHLGFEYRNWGVCPWRG